MPWILDEDNITKFIHRNTFSRDVKQLHILAANWQNKWHLFYTFYQFVYISSQKSDCQMPGFHCCCYYCCAFLFMHLPKCLRGNFFDNPLLFSVAREKEKAARQWAKILWKFKHSKKFDDHIKNWRKQQNSGGQQKRRSSTSQNSHFLSAHIPCELSCWCLRLEMRYICPIKDAWIFSPCIGHF